ncbi:MAG: pilus assembly protein CpaE [Lapillicoccus sp.]
MLTLELAQQLKTAGLVWTPASGDRFIVPVEDMEDRVFFLSDVTADIHRFASGDLIGFNGTTEWALDSIEQERVVWFPREDQLRVLLGAAFSRLEQVSGGYAVTATAAGGVEARFIDIDPERAYARALLSRLAPPKG